MMQILRWIVRWIFACDEPAEPRSARDRGAMWSHTTPKQRISRRDYSRLQAASNPEISPLRAFSGQRGEHTSVSRREYTDSPQPASLFPPGNNIPYIARPRKRPAGLLRGWKRSATAVNPSGIYRPTPFARHSVQINGGANHSLHSSHAIRFPFSRTSP